MEHTFDLSETDFPAFCRAHGLKCTAQRHVVFSAIRKMKGHPAIDAVHAQVKKTIPTITRDTVYRVLEEFSAQGLLTRLDALSAARYDTWTAPHAHFICEVCGKVTDYPLPEGLKLPEGMPSDRRHLELRVTGVCDACKKRGK